MNQEDSICLSNQWELYLDHVVVLKLNLLIPCVGKLGYTGVE